MLKDIDKRKYNLIQAIIYLEDESAISRLEDELVTIQKAEKLWHSIIKPMRKSITMAEMKEEQHYVPIDEKTFFELADQVGIEEPIEDLLAMLD